MKYSQQALAYIKIVPDFDIEEFEKYLMENFVIGGGDVMMFLASKDPTIKINNPRKNAKL